MLSKSIFFWRFIERRVEIKNRCPSRIPRTPAKLKSYSPKKKFTIRFYFRKETVHKCRKQAVLTQFCSYLSNLNAKVQKQRNTSEMPSKHSIHRSRRTKSKIQNDKPEPIRNLSQRIQSNLNWFAGGFHLLIKQHATRLDLMSLLKMDHF